MASASKSILMGPLQTGQGACQRTREISEGTRRAETSRNRIYLRAAVAVALKVGCDALSIEGVVALRHDHVLSELVAETADGD